MNLILILVILGSISFADEIKTDQVPVKYQEAQDIMAKKKIDGKRKVYNKPSTINYLDITARMKGRVQSGTDKPSIESQVGIYESKKTESPTQPVISFNFISQEKYLEKPDLFEGIDLSREQPYHFSEDIVANGEKVDFVNSPIIKNGGKK